ncbi:MAG: ATP-binding protein [Defluviitaleaceae bacterium]|nr:ATP-binding protein [Defluviitaleaceae bacterium]
MNDALVLFALLGYLIIFIFLGISVIILNTLNKRLSEKNKHLLEDNKRLQQDNARLVKSNEDFFESCHNIWGRVSAMELALVQAAFSDEEKASIKIDLSNLTHKFSNNLSKILPHKFVKKTGISELDRVFNYYNARCIDQKIDFQLMPLEPVNALPQYTTPDELCELATNLIENAIKAISYSQSPLKTLYVRIGRESGVYILCVIDSGEAFTPDVLELLGSQRVSTDIEYGFGFGYKSIFRIIRLYKASLTIHEIQGGDDGNASKSVTIIFNEKQRNTFKTYRKNEFKNGGLFTVVEG